MLWLWQWDVGFQALLARQEPSTAAILHRPDRVMRIAQTSVSAFTYEPTDTARCRPIFRFSSFFFFIPPTLMNLDNFAWSEEEARQRHGISKIGWQTTHGARGGVILHVVTSPDQRAERKKGWTVPQSLSWFLLLFKIVLCGGKKKKNGQNLFNAAVFNYSKA